MRTLKMADLTGVMAPLLGVIPIFAIGFSSFGIGKTLVQTHGQLQSEDLNGQQLVFAGMFSGLVTTPLTVPVERIKCLLQMQTSDGHARKYAGFMNCAVQLYREAGIRNLYVGTCVTLLRDIPASGVYFGTYELMMRYISNHSVQEAMWQPIFSGGFAGMINWAVAMPVDVLKSRLQISSTSKYPHGVRSLLPIILKQEGPFILYRGVFPIMLRAFPANAACFLGFEVTIKYLEAYMPWL